MPIVDFEKEERENIVSEIKGMVYKMTVDQMISFLGKNWDSEKACPETFQIIYGNASSGNLSGDFFNVARELVTTALKQAVGRDQVAPADDARVEMLTGILRGMSDKDLALWFRNFRYQMGTNNLSLMGPTGTQINFNVSYFEAFGHAVASRLETVRVTENQLIVEMGTERPVNPMTAVKKFTVALEEFIKNGPEEPVVRAYGATRTISQAWMEWYCRTHACKFDVAWREAAKRMVESEIPDPEQRARMDWYPNNANPFEIVLGLKLEYIHE